MKTSKQKFEGQVEGFLGVGENCTPEFAIKYGDILPSFFSFLIIHIVERYFSRKRKGGKGSL